MNEWNVRLIEMFGIIFQNFIISLCSIFFYFFAISAPFSYSGKKFIIISFHFNEFFFLSSFICLGCCCCVCVYVSAVSKLLYSILGFFFGFQTSTTFFRLNHWQRIFFLISTTETTSYNNEKKIFDWKMDFYFHFETHEFSVCCKIDENYLIKKETLNW